MKLIGNIGIQWGINKSCIPRTCVLLETKVFTWCVLMVQWPASNVQLLLKHSLTLTRTLRLSSCSHWKLVESASTWRLLVVYFWWIRWALAAAGCYHRLTCPCLSCLRNRLPVGGGCVYVLQFFLFFFRPPKLRQPFSGTEERIFMQLSPNDKGNVVWNAVPPLGESRAAAWRMLMLCVIYDMTLSQSPEGATGGCVIQQWAGELM